MFKPYSFDMPFERAEFLELIPENAMVRGMFFDTLKKVLVANGKDPIEGKWIPFKQYPRREYMELAFEVAATLRANPAEGDFEIGRFTYSEFAESLIGKTVLMIAGRSFEQLCRAAPRGYAASNKFGEVTVLSVDERQAHAVFDGLWEQPHLTLGIIHAAMDVAGVQGDSILYQSNQPAHLELKIEYSPKQK